MPDLNTQQIIETLGLTPHPEEGGFFREMYRCEDLIAGSALPERYGGPRSHATAIYYLLTPETFSAMHRLQSDEVFHHYSGAAVEMVHLWPDGSGRMVVLGPDLASGQRPQIVVPRGVWQGARLKQGGDYALLGCTVAPGFEYADYEHGRRSRLAAQYPELSELIVSLTPPDQ